MRIRAGNQQKASSFGSVPFALTLTFGLSYPEFTHQPESACGALAQWA
jgi:hypothetical protein